MGVVKSDHLGRGAHWWVVQVGDRAHRQPGGSRWPQRSTGSAGEPTGIRSLGERYLGLTLSVEMAGLFSHPP